MDRHLSLMSARALVVGGWVGRNDVLEQLPRELCESAEISMRADSAGATHELLDFCHDANIRFSVGYDLNEA
ncbi:MAG: hypothetical protein WKF96_18270, partial [Solirubrobacteraceae bacterium]